jgi:hypothetical protein
VVSIVAQVDGVGRRRVGVQARRPSSGWPLREQVVGVADVAVRGLAERRPLRHAAPDPLLSKASVPVGQSVVRMARRAVGDECR